MKKTLLTALLALGFAGAAGAETFSAHGATDVSVKASGDVINARRLAREQAEKDAVESILKTALSADVKSPKVMNALADLRKQLADSMRTTYSAEGDVLHARTVLEVDSARFLDLARSLGVTSGVASAGAKVLFLIDEYYGVGTRLDPSKPLLTEIDYSHDKSSMSDRSSASAGSKSASSSAASAAKGSYAAASSDKAAYAASSSSAAAGRDRAAFSASERGSAAYQDGYGGAAAASRSSQAAGARDSQFAASQKSAVAGSASSQSATSANFQSASASKSASASSHAEHQNDIQRQNDVVNLKVRQVFPGIDNAKPADGASALINQKLQQVVGEFGLAYTDERDFRVEGGRRMTVAEIEKLQKFDGYLKKAAQGNYKAKYLVYGQALMQSEGQSPSGQVECTGQLGLTSSDVDTGEGFVADTIVKRAVGSSDQNCRANLAEAMARTLADKIGTKAQRQLQQASTQGKPYSVALYSALKVPGKLRRDFSKRMKDIAGVVEVGDDTNATDEMRRWNVVAKGNFAEQIEDLVDEFKEADNSAYKNARFEKRGNSMMFCIEGKCPEQL